MSLETVNIETEMNVPILDNPIDVTEVDYVLRKQVKTNKGAGMEGVCPGLFKYLPVQWILTLTFLFNSVFYNGYPYKWSFARLNMLFKKGNPLCCDNFRGISVINSIAKIYDYVLYNRLIRWFIPDREQAGAQPQRSCIEHIVTLRLLLNFCARRKLKLFVVFVDFSKAYDRVPRNRLMHLLKGLGCGFAMLFALFTMYKVTNSILGVALITATIGVKQGSPTSCFLFTVFVNPLIRMLKDRCGEDGYLRWLHVLMLMDDTVILATNRESALHKTQILHDYCESHGMVVNGSKTKFMVINGDDVDKQCIEMGDLKIYHCDEYVYLGSIFTSDGRITTSLQRHFTSKQKHFHKLVMFLCTNKDVPFVAKWKVVTAAFNAAILYGCEGWLDCSCNVMNSLYVGGLKMLLGVRSTTTNDLCLLELGMPPLQALVKDKQQSFFNWILDERHDMNDDPFMFVWRLTQVSNRKMFNYIENVLSDTDHVGTAGWLLRDKVRRSDRTKSTTYMEINPELSVHPVYSKSMSNECFIPECYRIYFSRMRLSSHRLRVELGRWARLPRAQRLCPCGSIQDEPHVLCVCPFTQPLRNSYGHAVIYPEVLHNATNLDDFRFIHDVLKYFE